MTGPIQNHLGQADEASLYAAIKKAVTVDYQKTDLPGRTVFHGTVESAMESVQKGPEDMGRGFGGKGLYVALDNEKELAEEYAFMKKQLTRGKEVVTKGELNPGKNYRVARIQLAHRYRAADL